MVLIAIIVAGLVQLFLPKCRLDTSHWLRWYMQKMLHVMGQSAQNLWLSVIFMCLPIWIVVLLVLALFNWILGPIAFWILVFFISWLCLDIYPARNEDTAYDAKWVASKRDAVFSPVFWFGIFKTPLLVLYSLLRFMRDNWHAVEGNNQTSNPCADVIAVLAWVPARLMVIAAAVVGDFTATVKASASFWLESLRADGTQLWAAMQAGLRQKPPEGEQAMTSNHASFQQYCAVLIVWLVVIAIFTVGYWFAG
jgi:membrane protein required for beta-lactamase induction